MQRIRPAAPRWLAAAPLLIACLVLTAPAAWAAPPGPAPDPVDATLAAREPCSFARCAPRAGNSWGSLAGFGGAVAFCGWVGRRRQAGREGTAPDRLSG
jgi:hypothetical protein